MRSNDVVMRLIHEGGDVRDVQWSEFVTMVLKDSCLDTEARWRSLIIDDLPPLSDEVDAKETDVSDERVNALSDLAEIPHSMIHILLLPLMEKFMRTVQLTLEGQDIDITHELMMEYIDHTGPVLHNTLMTAAITTLSVLNDLGFISLTERFDIEISDLDFESLDDLFPVYDFQDEEDE